MKKIEVTNIFSTPISIIDLDEETQHLIDQEIENVICEDDFFPISYPWRQPDFVNAPQKTTSFFLDKYNLTFTKQKILEQVDNYIFSIIGKSILELKLKTSCIYSWLTKSYLHNYFNTHHHGHSGISGIYYHKVLPGGSNLYFRSIDKCTEISPIYKFSRNDAYEVEVKPGRMVLFPGWLEHGTAGKNDSGERISLAFDIVLREEDNDYQ